MPSTPDAFQSPKRLDIDVDDDATASEPMNPIEVVLGVSLGIALIAGFSVYLGSTHGGVGRLGLNQINAAMLGLGLILHGAPTRYLRAVEDAAQGVRRHHRPVPALRGRDGDDGGEWSARAVSRKPPSPRARPRRFPSSPPPARRS